MVGCLAYGLTGIRLVLFYHFHFYSQPALAFGLTAFRNLVQTAQTASILFVLKVKLPRTPSPSIHGKEEVTSTKIVSGTQYTLKPEAW